MAPAPARPPVVVVTGGSSGIGRATGIAYAARGAHVVLAARGVALLEEAVEECRTAGATTVRAVPTDVLDPEAVDALLATALDEHGRVDVVVHSAMVMAYGEIEAVPRPVFERVVDTSLHGTANVARSALPALRGDGGGALVVVTSVVASIAVPGIGTYVAAKWGQMGLVRVLQMETRTDVVDVLSVAPGSTDTPIYKRAANQEGRAGRPPPPVDPPERVAAAVLRAVDRRRARVSVAWVNPVIVAGFRFATPLYDRLVGPLYRHLAHERQAQPVTDGNVFEASTPDGLR